MGDKVFAIECNECNWCDENVNDQKVKLHDDVEAVTDFMVVGWNKHRRRM